jgi:5-methylcytosine-specific restriction protein B
MASIRGGSALKHLIFKRQGDDTGWYFERKYSSVAEAWEQVRAGFVEAFRLAQEGRFQDIGGLEAINGAVALSTKAVYTYFPNDLLPVCSGTHQEHFWQVLGGTGPIIRGVPAARSLRELVVSLPELKDRDMGAVMHLLYRWADPRLGSRIVKIAPGRNAELWDDCLRNGYMRIGWDEVGDLREYESRTQFQARFAEAYAQTYRGNGPKISEKANEVWTLMELQPGDIVIANQGTSRVVGIGTVTDRGYERRDDIGDFGQTIGVSWDDQQVREIDPIKRWAFKTVAPVSAAEYQRILAGRSASGLARRGASPVTTVDPVLREIASELRRKGQVILYGPPGTGKTYHARRFSVWWLSEATGSTDAAALLSDSTAFRAAEDQLTKPALGGRVWWMVANPKEWSWDHLFRDGTVDYRFGRLKKNYALLTEGDLVVGYQSNPTKRIVALARITQTLHETDQGERITLSPLHRVKDGPSWEDVTTDDRLRSSEPIQFRSQGTLFALTSAESRYLLSWLKERDPDLPELADADDVGAVGPITRVTFHPSYTYEDFVEGFKPKPTTAGTLHLELEDGVFKRVCAAARAKPDQPFLLLIDEINRGNIPKIFGELITLLERDKRGLSVLLPLSRDPFDVPKNVFVLGTMNTADRSIRLLDAALRRRFAFIELMPDTGVVEGAMVGDLDLGLFLAMLNDRIARTEGREKQIGHSFFLDESGQPISDLDDFAAQFRHEIVPLLQEYAFEDYAELESYLGSAVVDADNQRIRAGVLGDAQALIDALMKSFGDATSVDDEVSE